jgi:hypothetical protein
MDFKKLTIEPNYDSHFDFVFETLTSLKKLVGNNHAYGNMIGVFQKKEKTKFIRI